MASTLDQQYNPTVDGATKLRFDANSTKQAFQFTPSVTAKIAQIDLTLYKTVAPSGNMWIEIWTDTGSDAPNAQTGGDSATIAAASVTETSSPGGVYSFTWTTNIPSLTASTKYWAVWDGNYSIDGTNYLQAEVKLTDSTVKTASWDGGAWNSNSFSTWYNEYYTPATAGFFAIL